MRQMVTFAQYVTNWGFFFLFLHDYSFKISVFDYSLAETTAIRRRTFWRWNRSNQNNEMTITELAAVAILQWGLICHSISVIPFQFKFINMIILLRKVIYSISLRFLKEPACLQSQIIRRVRLIIISDSLMLIVGRNSCQFCYWLLTIWVRRVSKSKRFQFLLKVLLLTQTSNCSFWKNCNAKKTIWLHIA